MITSPDIINRIRSDFGENAEKAVELLEEAVSKYRYLNNDRIIRCIIHLAGKNVEELKLSIHQARQDPRDVMLWAEYTNLQTGQTPVQVRDFNNPFDNCEIEGERRNPG